MEMLSRVNFVVMNVSGLSADTGPGLGVATASLKGCRGACSAPFIAKNGSECAYRRRLQLATSSAYTVKTSAHAQCTIHLQSYAQSQDLVLS